MRVLFLVLTMSAFAAQAHAQIADSLRPAPPAGYYRAADLVLPDTLLETTLNGRFRISIHRRAGNDLERRLLDEAERMMPSRELLTAARPPRTSADTIQGDRWFWAQFDDMLIPFALTGRTVQHLVEYVRGWSRGPNPFARWDPGFAHGAALRYNARVERGSAGTAYVAVLQLSMDTECGRRCGTHFDHSRRVYFDAAGRVLRIEGDNAPAVSAN